MSSKLQTVVIFGRTNVGKSTLFNRLIEKRQALISDIEGTTRDSNIGQVEWQGRIFELIDTGGIMETGLITKKETKKDRKNKPDLDEAAINMEVQKQAINFLKAADVILFVVDCKSGLLPQDKEMADNLKRILPKNKKIILVANKSDNQKIAQRASEFFKLSLGEPMTVSSTSGSGTGDLLDEIVKKLFGSKKVHRPQKTAEHPEITEQGSEIINVCLMGKPNVGKSSLLNSLLGYERVIVSPVPHTTREPQDTEITFKNRKIRLIDTAGISKKGKQSTRHRVRGVDSLVKYGIAKSLNTLNQADIVLFVIDINEEITHQDAQIVQELIEKNKSIIIIANKWDLIKEKDTKKFTQYIYGRLPFITWAPLQFISAKTGEKVNKILDLIIEIGEKRRQEIPDSQLNTFLMKVIKIHRPSKSKGLKHPYIYELKQTYVNPPKFKLRIGAKDTLHFSYVRFLENRLREKFDFPGTPLDIWVSKNRQIHGTSEGRPNQAKPQINKPKK